MQLENETNKLLWDFDIQTDHVNSVRRPDIVIINEKENQKIVEFAVPADHIMILKENEKKDKYADLDGLHSYSYFQVLKTF